MLFVLPELSTIKKIRKNLCLTQAELAKLADVSQSLIAKIESGKIVPNYEKAKRIFDALESLSISEERKAADIMSKHVVSVRENDSVIKAAKLMEKHAFSQLPVIKNGRSIGTVTEHTIIESLQKGLDPKKAKVRDIMRESLPIIPAETKFSALACLLEHEQALLVAKKGRIVGIITKSDLLKEIV